MKRDQVLLDLVIEEAANLKKYATKRELNNLDIETLDGDDGWECIYGQMTGHCSSKRSYKLIKKCCKKVYKTTNQHSVFSNKLNGKPKRLAHYGVRLDFYTSPIENFLYRYQKGSSKSKYVARLVKFLKGEIEELKF